MSESKTTVSADLTFAMVPEWLLDAEVSAQAIRLYAVLSRYADRDGIAFPSRKALAERLKVRDKGTVDRALKELVDVHAVTVRGRVDDAGDHTSNVYVVHATPQPIEVARDSPLSPGSIRSRPRFSYRKRARIYDRDGWSCMSCGALEDLTLDHVHPRSRGGRNDDDNLQTLCRSCNSRKGARVSAIPQSVEGVGHLWSS